MSSLGARRFNVLWRFGLGLGWVDSRRVLLVLSWFSGSLCAGRSPDPWRCLTASPYPVSAAGPLVCSLPLFESRCASSLYQPGSLFTFFTYNKFYLKKKIGSIVYIIFTKFLCIMCVCACVCVCVFLFTKTDFPPTYVHSRWKILLYSHSITARRPSPPLFSQMSRLLISPNNSSPEQHFFPITWFL